MRRTPRFLLAFAIASSLACMSAPAMQRPTAQSGPESPPTADPVATPTEEPQTEGQRELADSTAATTAPTVPANRAPATAMPPPSPPAEPMPMHVSEKSVAGLDSLQSIASGELRGGGVGMLEGRAGKEASRTRGHSALDPVLDFNAGPVAHAKPADPAKPDTKAKSVDDGDESSSFDEGGDFKSAGINDLIDTKTDALSTFAIDVDTGAYSLARRYLNAGSLPPAAGVRVEEWVNAFRYSYTDDAKEHPFSIHVEGAPLSKQSQVVRIGIQGKRVEKADREPVHLTFLVDVSGSMTPSDRLPMAKRALDLLVDELNAKDSVSIVTYAGSTQVILANTDVTAQHRAKIHDAIDGLRNGGGTNMGSGMELAYREATKALATKGSSRVIVLSDGDANIGHVSHQQMLQSIKGYVSEGVTMSTVGFGTGNYRDNLMEQLADAGNGNYSYVGSMTDAKKIFVDDLTGTLQVIAKDTKIQVEMNPAVVAKYRLIGYENRDVRDQDFRNDKVDAGEIGAGHTVTALYEVQLANDGAAGGTLCTVHVRYKTPKGTKATETTATFTTAQLATDVRGLSSDGRFAVGVGLAAESMRHSPHMARLGLTLADAHVMMSSALDGPYANERKEIVNLIAPLAGGSGVARR